MTDEVRELIYELFGIDIDNQAQRIEAGRQSLLAFCLIYLPHYFTLDPAEFHGELIDILDDDEEEALAILGFRGCAKTTLCSLAKPLQSALYVNYHFPIIINETVSQMRINILNIKKEVEDNKLIKKDFPALRHGLKWTEEQLEFPNDVLVLGRSRGQKIRGLKYRQYRPDLIIGDDLEDLEWVRKKENRDKTERWFDSEVVPAQDELRCKMVIIGNLLHKDALMSRLKRRKLYKCLEFPLIDKTGEITWKGKYPNMKAVEKQKEKVNSITAWNREYLLKIISEDEQVIAETDIKYYPNEHLDRVDEDGRAFVKIKDAGVGVDLAISLKETADYTTAVAGYRAEYNGDRILIRPNPLNAHIDFSTTQERLLDLQAIMPLGVKFFVEDVGYQKAAIQTLQRSKVSVVAMRPIADKKARLEAVAPYIKSGFVMFAEKGCEVLIDQLLNFGVDEHDDLVDALVYLILGLINKKSSVAVGKIDQM